MEYLKTYESFGNLINEGKVNDFFSKFNLIEIKKLLKEKMDIDTTSTKMEVAKKLLKYSGKLQLKLLKYELGAVLGGFVFYFLSMILDITGVDPFATTLENPDPTTPHFLLWGAGALLNVIRIVWKDSKSKDEILESKKTSKLKFNKQPRKKGAKTDVYNVVKNGTTIGQVKWYSRLRGYGFLPPSGDESEVKEFVKEISRLRREEKKKNK